MTQSDERESNNHNTPGSKSGSNGRAVKKIVFDDFQITRAEQQAQVDEERRVWQEREDRIQREKTPLFKLAVPRLKSLRDEMIGVQNKLGFLKRNKETETHEPLAHQEPQIIPQEYAVGNEPYFAEHERAVVHISKKSVPPSHVAIAQQAVEEPEQETEPEPELIITSAPEAEPSEFEAVIYEPESDLELETAYDAEATFDEEPIDSYFVEEVQESIPAVIGVERATIEFEPAPFTQAQVVTPSQPTPLVLEEPHLEPAMQAYLDTLRSFDSQPRRSSEPRDPRSDFVVILAEELDILREQVGATSAMFFWVNTKRQHLVLESAALDDQAYQFLVSDKRFPIELDAVSRVVAKRKPELHSTIPPQAERDLIPYYRDAIGISSFAGMPVFFGDGLVAVLTVDSATPDQFSPETLRILTNHSRLLSALIRSYIEKYDLLASARALDATRMLNQIVSPDQSARMLREQRRNPDFVLRALTQAASEIIEWDWLAAASFDESRRVWSIASLQSKHGGAYVPPMTPISLEESLVGKCLSTGQSIRQDSLGAQSIRFNIEEDRQSASGHAFLAIPIRTTNRNYGALAIEHSDRGHYTDADVETLEHLSRSAASALEIMALSAIVQEKALTDLLTDLLNKHGLLMRTHEELQRATQFDEPLTLVLFEIDGASEFATKFSQEDSDTIVLAIARLVKFGARPFDVIARTGEHTFAALLIRMPDEDAYLWSEKMRKMIVSEVIAIGRRSFSVTVSAGVSGARRDGTVEELVSGAELALERASELGGNNVIVY